ncbi:hypothetical protein ACI65C_013715 [Semiaphis heraclei]
MDKNTLINACIELVSENGRPLSILEDSGFKKILNPLLKAIEPELKNRLICLKVDGVTRLDRCILGINCQYFSDGKIKILTLGLIQLLDKHTGSYLKEMLMIILERYSVTSDQIFTITCDNAKIW